MHRELRRNNAAGAGLTAQGHSVRYVSRQAGSCRCLSGQRRSSPGQAVAERTRDRPVVYKYGDAVQHAKEAQWWFAVVASSLCAGVPAVVPTVTRQLSSVEGFAQLLGLVQGQGCQQGWRCIGATHRFRASARIALIKGQTVSSSPSVSFMSYHGPCIVRMQQRLTLRRLRRCSRA